LLTLCSVLVECWERKFLGGYSTILEFGGYTSERVGVDNAVWDLEATRNLKYFQSPQDIQSKHTFIRSIHRRILLLIAIEYVLDSLLLSKQEANS
jgi:hypothetical protein